jgi:hypothetical protein
VGNKDVSEPSHRKWPLSRHPYRDAAEITLGEIFNHRLFFLGHDL